MPHLLRVARTTNCTRIAEMLPELLRIAHELPSELPNGLGWIGSPSGLRSAVDTLHMEPRSCQLALHFSGDYPRVLHTAVLHASTTVMMYRACVASFRKIWKSSAAGRATAFASGSPKMSACKNVSRHQPHSLPHEVQSPTLRSTTCTPFHARQLLLPNPDLAWAWYALQE